MTDPGLAHRSRRSPVWIAVFVTMAAGAGIWGAGLAAADPTRMTLHYMCTLSPYPAQAMTVQLTWNAPASVMVGQTTATATATVTATVGPTVTWALGLVGAATVEGSVDAPGVVDAPEGNISAAVRLTVPRTDVPVSGPMTIQAAGTAPGLVFRQPGHATINVGSGLALRLTPADADGNPTAAGEVTLSCTLDPGQNTVMSSLEITSAAAAVPTAGTVTAPAGGLTGTVAPGPSGSPSSQASSTTPSPEVSGTGHPTVTDPTATRSNVDGPESTSSTFRPVDRTTAAWWLAGAGILAAAVIGCVWWLMRRRRTEGR
jgi:hypothetical protein